MSASLRRQDFRAGETIFSEGESARFAYLIERGMVELRRGRKGREAVLARLGDGALIGEGALLDAAHRGATAIALEDTRVIVFDRDEVRGRVDGADELVKRLLDAALRGLGEARGHGPDGGALAGDTGRADGGLAADLRRAIEREELDLHFQPIVTLETGYVAGFEALVRWQHTEHGAVAPSTVVRLAEETGTIERLGHWMLRRALDGLNRLQAAATKGGGARAPIYVSVNVSSLQLLDREAVDDLAGIVRDSDISSAQVVFEITETLMVENPDDVAAAIERLRRQGIRVATDDFGTGYANLSFLSRFPVDILKIDRSFVTAMTEDRRNAKIVETIIELAKDFGMSIVAEGIESKAEVEALRALECEFGQGFLMAKPLPLDAAVALAGKRFRW